jgi:hypothetical protein
LQTKRQSLQSELAQGYTTWSERHASQGLVAVLISKVTVDRTEIWPDRMQASGIIATGHSSTVFQGGLSTIRQKRSKPRYTMLFRNEACVVDIS